ncbi:MAG: F0F1-type ATP synthase membrane subunit a [Flavobacterium sp.]|jgi:F0F1-type ATP synthase membrane subunit a
MEELLSLQKNYNISDKDMYILSKLDQNKVNESFIEKTKSATKQEVVLKKYRLTLAERQKVLKNLRFSTFHTNEELVEKYKGAELDEELQAEGKKGINKLMVIIVVAVLFIVFANVFSSSSETKQIESKKILFTEAKEFMQKRLNDVNQELMGSKTVYFDGKAIFMFLSVTENGMTCISGVSEFKLEVMSTDCGNTDLKIQEWNNL